MKYQKNAPIISVNNQTSSAQLAGFLSWVELKCAAALKVTPNRRPRLDPEEIRAIVAKERAAGRITIAPPLTQTQIDETRCADFSIRSPELASALEAMKRDGGWFSKTQVWSVADRHHCNRFTLLRYWQAWYRHEKKHHAAA